MQTSDIESQIRGDLGPSVAIRLADPRPRPPPLWPEEEAAVARAVEKRRREFGWGRHLARQALSALGAPAGPLPARPDRRPRWPAGFIGSITHCPDLCAVVVVRRSDVETIGLDVELRTPLEPELWPIVATPNEIERLDLHPGSEAAGERAKTLFVIKEAFYKAQFELTETMLDFSDVEVVLERDGRFSASVRPGGLSLSGWTGQTETHRWAWSHRSWGSVRGRPPPAPSARGP